MTKLSVKHGVKDGVCERWCVTKWCVTKMVCERGCVGKIVCERGCVKDGV